MSERLVISLVVLAASTACAQVQSVELRLDETTVVEWIGSSPASLSIEWRQVTDSRCPRDVTCVWEGEVAVELWVSTGTDEPVQVMLIPDKPKGEGSTAVLRQGHTLRIDRVTPEPVADGPPPRSDYRALLTVSPPDVDLPVPTAVPSRSWGTIKTTRGP